MNAQVILRRLVEMAGGPAERGYVLALAAEGLRDLPSEFPTSSGKYAVVHLTSEIGLRHVLWKADGAPVLALLDEPLARRLPADLVRRARGRRVHAVEPAEVLSLALQVPVVGTGDDDVERLAIDNVERLQAALRERTLPTVVDRELLDELLLDVLLGKQVRKCSSGELLASWLRDPPNWTPPVADLVRRQLPKMHGLEGRILAWGTKEPKSLEPLFVHGVLLALEEPEIPQSAWGALWNAPRALGLTLETFRTAVAGLARQTVDFLGADATAYLKKAESIATRVLTPTVLARSRDLPLGLDNLCHELVKEMGGGHTVGHAAIQEMQRHRFAAARAGEIAVLEQMARLSRYLAAPQLSATGSVFERVRTYQRDGAFADWAAARLRTALAKSASFRKEAGRVLDRYRERRDGENLAFAEALRTDYKTALYSSDCVALPRIWRHAPVHLTGEKQRRLFLVVLDGCSYPVFLRLVAELANDIAPLGLRVDPTTQQAHGTPALSIVPTITSHARSAIFLGEVPNDPWIAETIWRDTKESSTDPARFKQNTSLGSRARKLFLKGDLADHGEDLFAALRDDDIDVVAAVFNAVDDQIGSSNTGAVVTVRAEEISAFIPSLREGIRAGRRVIVTADHGHTPFWGKELRVSDGATARYRTLQGKDPAPEGFIEIDEGGHGGGAGRKAYAWKMGVYQGQPQVGFHGGCSLEEMVVPLAELAEGGVAADVPAWWYGGASTAGKTSPPAKVAAVVAAVAPIATKVVQGDLFDPGPLLAVTVERIGLPAALRAQLDQSELAALACVFSNQNARISDIAQALRRPKARVPGLMSRLVGKLHSGGFACLRRQALPDGEDQYVYVRQGTERT